MLSAMKNTKSLERTAIEVRKRLIKLIYDAGGGHTGGSLSSVDILVALYCHTLKLDPQHPGWADRDRFILSKGHSVEGFYCVLSHAGFFSEDILRTYGQFGSLLAGHPTVKVPGVEVNSGALGHGLSVGTGMALAAKRDHKSTRVFVLMGDGEQGEGSVMEAANACSHYKLDNLTAIIDRNRLQISGNTEEIMSLDNLETRWKAYGWCVAQVNGNKISELVEVFERLPLEKGKPGLVIANTI
ncbi:MAG: transketolase, partial [Bacteroidetes bacterium RBG_13_46_8]